MIELSDEQGMLLETASDFCQKQVPLARVRDDIAAEQPFDSTIWQQIVELGWLAIAVPEAHGGLGLGLDSVVPVLESMGRQLHGSPLLATNLAIQALLHGDNDALASHWLPLLAAGSIGTVALLEEDGSWALDEIAATATPNGEVLELSGIKHQVLDASEAEVLLVSVRLSGEVVLVAVPKVGAARCTREAVIDETRRSFSVDLEGLQVPAANVLRGDALRATEQAAMLLIAAEMSGGIQGALAVIVEYLKTRKQFDRYIGSYQALKHPAVDILLASEATRSLVYEAASAWARNDHSVEAAVRIAKAQSSEAFAWAGDRAVQFHGGMGFTWECDAQLFLRRALWCQYMFGDEKHQRQLLAPMLLDVVG